MGSGATAKYAFEYPLDTDAPNVPGDVETLAQQIEAIMVAFAPDDTKANRPAVGKSGRMFVESAASVGLPGTMWREDGATWRAMGSRIQPNAIGDIGQIVRAIAGQTADLLHVEDSAGNAYFKVGNNGASTVTPGGASTATQAFLAQAGPANQRAIVAKMASSQTANPFEVQDTTGTLKAFIDPSGNVSDASGRVYSPGNPNLAGTVSAMTGFGLASAVGTGSAFARVDHNHGTPPTPATSVAGRTGAVTLTAADIAAGNFPGANTYAALQTFNAGTWASSNAIGNVTATLQGISGQTADMLDIKTSGGALVTKVTAAGVFSTTTDHYIGGNAIVGSTVGGSGAMGQFSVYNAFAGNVAASVQAAFGQTANIQEWKANSGSLLAFVNSAGILQSNAGLVVVPSGASQVPAIVKAAASQTADLQEWLSSTGTALSRVSPGGAILTSGVLSAGNTSGLGSTLSVDNASTPSLVAAIIKGGVSQSANLQQWQSNTGSVLSGVDSGGAIFAGPAGPLARISASAANAGDTPMRVRGFAGQTAWLQEWQNSAGTVKAYVDASGTVGAQGSFGSGAAAFSADLRNSASTTSIGYYVTMQSGQVGDAIDIGTSTGGQVARITASGNVQGTGAYTTLSDASVKMNVRDMLHDPIDVVRRLRPVHFDYIGGPRDQVGFIANEVEPVLPHAVSPWDKLYGGIPDNEGSLGLQTDAILAYAVGALQDLDRRLAALERVA